MADYMQAPPRNALLGALADAAKYVDDYAQRPDSTMPMGKANALLSVLSRFAGVPAVASTLDRLSYGDSLTTGSGWTTHVRPEVVEAAMAAAPVMQAAGRATTKGANALADASVRAITRNPQATAVNALAYARDMAPVNPLTVWHGSPHKFDRFDSSKIGTGEGAQAYGHGLYLAESPDVASAYAGMRPAAGQSTLDGKPWQAERYAEMLGEARARGAGSYEKGIDSLERDFQKAVDAREINVAENFRAAIDALRSMQLRGVELNTGQNIYKVDLPDEAIARMLDWDKPLSQQPKNVQDAWREIYGEFGMPVNEGEMIGPTAMRAMLEQDLRKRGVPGVRYLDGGSRGAGGGTSNFVVFPGEENALTILERNGKPVR